jgi:pimeloyl-ACP methyl ester carboxylesterase
LDWPDDVVELADALGFEKFPIVGGSGGVPATLACAYKIPERLSAVGVLFGPRPIDSPGATNGWSRSRRIQAFLEQNGPFWLPRIAMLMVSRIMRDDPEKALSKMFEELPPSDRATMDDPKAKKQYIMTIREAFRTGPDGVTLDKILTMKPWGFKLEDIFIEIHLWHGEADSVVPPAMGHYLADTIPNCQARFIPKEGHFSLLPNHAQEILEVLVKRDT